MSSIFAENSKRLKKGIGLINLLDNKKLLQILRRIINKVHLKDDAIFTSEEKEKLEIALDLETAEVQTVLETVVFIIEQIAYHNIKPDGLEKHLEILSLTEEKMECFVSLWNENAVNVIQLLKKINLGPNQLDTVKWRLSLQLARNNHSKLKIPSSILELGITTSDSNSNDNLQMEFSHDNLYNLFQQLEDIQEQIDNLK